MVDWKSTEDLAGRRRLRRVPDSGGVRCGWDNQRLASPTPTPGAGTQRVAATAPHRMPPESFA